MNENRSWKIELLRHRLYTIVEECHGNLQHPQVIEASQRLDVELTRWWALQCIRAYTRATAVS